METILIAAFRAQQTDNTMELTIELMETIDDKMNSTFHLYVVDMFDNEQLDIPVQSLEYGVAQASDMITGRLTGRDEL